MRIATSTIYEQQATAMDNQAALQLQLGNEISSGKAVTAPSDDPTHIGQDLLVRTLIDQQNTASSNITAVTSQLTTTDSALSTLTSVLQTARQIAVQGANDTLSASDRAALASQVDGLFSQAVGVANTNYAGTYLFAGTAELAQPPVTSTGAPSNQVTFAGNLQSVNQVFADNQQVKVSTTLQEAFNYQAADGSKDVFQVLSTLRSTLAFGTVVDQTATAVNAAGKTVDPSQSLAANAAAGNFNVPFAADSNGHVAFTINAGRGAVYTFDQPAATATPNSIVAAINAAGIGVTAAFDPKSQRFALSGTSAFSVTDVPSAGLPPATGAANFTTVFGLSAQASVVNNLSSQLGDIDRVLGVTLHARAVIGSNINAIATTQTQLNQAVVDNTKVVSGIEDADIPSVVSKFSQTQTVLQAAYATTTRLEGKTLMDYLG